MPFSRKRISRKLQIIKDGRPCPSLPNAKGRDKDNKKTEFHFKEQKPVK